MTSQIVFAIPRQQPVHSDSIAMNATLHAIVQLSNIHSTARRPVCDFLLSRHADSHQSSHCFGELLPHVGSERKDGEDVEGGGCYSSHRSKTTQTLASLPLRRFVAVVKPGMVQDAVFL